MSVSSGDDVDASKGNYWEVYDFFDENALEAEAEAIGMNSDVALDLFYDGNYAELDSAGIDFKKIGRFTRKVFTTTKTRREKFSEFVNRGVDGYADNDRYKDYYVFKYFMQLARRLTTGKGGTPDVGSPFSRKLTDRQLSTQFNFVDGKRFSKNLMGWNSFADIDAAGFDSGNWLQLVDLIQNGVYIKTSAMVSTSSSAPRPEPFEMGVGQHTMDNFIVPQYPLQNPSSGQSYYITMWAHGVTRGFGENETSMSFQNQVESLRGATMMIYDANLKSGHVHWIVSVKTTGVAVSPDTVPSSAAVAAPTIPTIVSNALNLQWDTTSQRMVTITTDERLAEVLAELDRACEPAIVVITKATCPFCIKSKVEMAKYLKKAKRNAPPILMVTFDSSVPGSADELRAMRKRFPAVIAMKFPTAFVYYQGWAHPQSVLVPSTVDDFEKLKRMTEKVDAVSSNAGIDNAPAPTMMMMDVPSQPSKPAPGLRKEAPRQRSLKKGNDTAATLEVFDAIRTLGERDPRIEALYELGKDMTFQNIELYSAQPLAILMNTAKMSLPASDLLGAQTTGERAVTLALSSQVVRNLIRDAFVSDQGLSEESLGGAVSKQLLLYTTAAALLQSALLLRNGTYQVLLHTGMKDESRRYFMKTGPAVSLGKVKQETIASFASQLFVSDYSNLEKSYSTKTMRYTKDLRMYVGRLAEFLKSSVSVFTANDGNHNYPTIASLEAYRIFMMTTGSAFERNRYKWPLLHDFTVFALLASASALLMEANLTDTDSLMTIMETVTANNKFKITDLHDMVETLVRTIANSGSARIV